MADNILKFGRYDADECIKNLIDSFELDNNIHFITKENTIEREIERGVYLHKKGLQMCGDSYPFKEAIQDWEMNPKKYISQEAENYFLYYLSSIWCERAPMEMWNSERIKSLDMWEIYREADEFFLKEDVSEFREAIDYGISLEQCWFMRTFMNKKNYLCIFNTFNKEIKKGNVPTDRIQYKIGIDPDRMLAFLDYYCMYQEKDEPIRHSGELCQLHLFLGKQPYILFPIPTFILGKTGHAIEIYGVEDDNQDIIFFDPWPGGSLIDGAEPWTEFHHFPVELWKVSFEDLRKVILSIFLPIEPISEDTFYYSKRVFPIVYGRIKLRENEIVILD